MYSCQECSQQFSRKTNLTRHVLQEHVGQSVKTYRDQTTPANNEFNIETKTVQSITRSVYATAFQNSVKYIRFTPNSKMLPHVFLHIGTPMIQETLTLLQQQSIYKIGAQLCVQFTKIGDPTKQQEAFFSVKAYNLKDFQLNMVIQTLLAQIETYIQRGSDWKISYTSYFQLIVTKIIV